MSKARQDRDAQEGKPYSEIQFSDPVDQQIQSLQVETAKQYGEATADAFLSLAVFGQASEALADVLTSVSPTIALLVSSIVEGMEGAVNTLGTLVLDGSSASVEAFQAYEKRLNEILAERKVAAKANMQNKINAMFGVDASANDAPAGEDSKVIVTES